MKKAAPSEVKRGQTISFRVPSDTPDHILKQLQKLKDVERRNFASVIAQYVMQGVGNSYAKDKESITIPLPKPLTKIQRDWLKHEHSEALLGNIVYQLIVDPVRSISILASMNSNATDIDDALYLQEETSYDPISIESYDEITEPTKNSEWQIDLDKTDDDLNDLAWDKVSQEKQVYVEETEKETAEDADQLLGAFLAQMNK